MSVPNSPAIRVLVVDDEPAVRELVEQVLRGEGYEVEGAGNGRDALQMLARGTFSVVITDLVMPEQEGIESIQIIKREYPHLKVIAVSGAFGGDYLRVARYMGADMTIPKPFKVEQLIQAVKDTLAIA